MDLKNSNTSKSFNQSTGFSTQSNDFPTGYALILIAFIIILGNSLVLLTVRSFKRRLVADILIFCLATLDVIHTLTSVLLAIVFKFTGLGKATEGNDLSIFRVLCQTQAWFTVTIQLQSVFIITLITLERFVAVSRPFFYKTLVKPSGAIKILISLFLVSVLLSSAPLLGWDEYGVLPKLALCMFRYDSSFAIAMVVIGYADLALVSYCFLAIGFSLTKFMRRQTYFAGRRGGIAGPQLAGKQDGHSMMSKNAAHWIKQSKRMIKVSAMVSFLFYFSWLPLLIGITLAQINKKSNDSIHLVASLLPLASPLVNPLIYFFSWERYKKSYIKIARHVLNCWPYRRSMKAKDLTKVPGPKSAIRQLVRNSGSLGRLELTECGDDADVCSDAWTPGPSATQGPFSGNNDGSPLEDSLDYFANDTESADALREYSYSMPNHSRRFTTAECVQIHYESFLQKHSSRNDPRRRHTIGEFSKELAELSVPRPTYDEMISQKEEVRKDSEEFFANEGEIMTRNAASKEPGRERELCQETSKNTRHFRTNAHSELQLWYSSQGQWKDEEACHRKYKYLVETSECRESVGNSSRKLDHSSRKRSELVANLKRNDRVSEGHACRTDKTLESEKEKDPSNNSTGESCLITQRIHEYLTSVIDAEESSDFQNVSRKECQVLWNRKLAYWKHFRETSEKRKEERGGSPNDWEDSLKGKANFWEGSGKEWRDYTKGNDDYRSEWYGYCKEDNSRKEWKGFRNDSENSPIVNKRRISKKELKHFLNDFQKGNHRIRSQEQNRMDGKFNFHSKPISAKSFEARGTGKEGVDIKRVTSSLRQKYRRRHGKKRTRSRSKNFGSSRGSRRTWNTKSSEGFSSHSPMMRYRKELKDCELEGYSGENAKERDMSIWTYL